jgi:hypothetical protein
VWYPLGLPWVEPLTWEPWGGTQLLCYVNNRKYATPFLGQRRTGAAGERVVRVEGLVLDFGLFPASDPSAWVIVESSLSPLGYGLRRLMARELGVLWDVPILLIDSLSETDVGLLMAAICASPPSKLLHTGADLLLTAVFRGGGVGRAREFLVPPGPGPLSDLELGLLSSMNKQQRVEAPPQDKVSTVEAVIKGNLQKADNASVPDHLWLRAFVVGYGGVACKARHRDALTLPTGDVRLLGASEPPVG